MNRTIICLAVYAGLTVLVSGATNSGRALAAANPAELFAAVEKGEKAAIDKDNFATPLLTALKKNDFETARYLVSKKADVNACSQAGCIIHQAARVNNTEAVIFLVEHGARADASFYTGETPLYGAVMSSNDCLVEFLLGKGADPNPGLTDSPSLLNQAKSKGNRKIVDMLEKAGAKDTKEISE